VTPSREKHVHVAGTATNRDSARPSLPEPGERIWRNYVVHDNHIAWRVEGRRVLYVCPLPCLLLVFGEGTDAHEILRTARSGTALRAGGGFDRWRVDR
jgi:hypothetical protein